MDSDGWADIGNTDYNGAFMENGVPIIPSAHAYIPVSPWEFIMPGGTNYKPCGIWDLHVPHYWDLATANPMYCLGLGSLETLNEH